jgi:hypothetical protein
MQRPSLATGGLMNLCDSTQRRHFKLRSLLSIALGLATLSFASANFPWASDSAAAASDSAGPTFNSAGPSSLTDNSIANDSLTSSSPKKLSLATGALAQTLSFPFVPDTTMTTGSLCNPNDPDFNRPRYKEMISYCSRNVSRETKAEIYAAYGVSRHCWKEYTIDHFIPLSIGGSNRVENLWPEHKSIKALRQELENDLYKRMSLGTITQAEAIRIIKQEKFSPPVTDPSEFKFCLQ